MQSSARGRATESKMSLDVKILENHTFGLLIHHCRYAVPSSKAFCLPRAQEVEEGT